MKVILQRVSQAQVKIDHQLVGQIQQGLVLFVGVAPKDTADDIDYLVRKISRMRIFSDSDDRMNLSVQDIGGAILSISQFTLYADTKKGNRPNFLAAAQADLAERLYQDFNQVLRHQTGLVVETGRFGADMQVNLTNDGPVTIILDSQVN